MASKTRTRERIQQATLERECTKYIYKPKHDRQREVCEKWADNQAIVAYGPAGTGKTSVGIGMAIQDLLGGKIEHIILCRPVATIDEELGFNKGSYDEKIAPWMASFKDALRGFSGVKLSELGTKVEYLSVGMVGGRTVRNAVMVVDEAQNLTRDQVRATLTRVGDNGKVMFCGDFEQAVNGRRKNNALETMCKLLKQAKCEEFTTVEFLEEDQLRSPFVRRVSKILREAKF